MKNITKIIPENIINMEADLIIDQVLIGWYGAFAVETMLQMGKKGDLLVFTSGSGQRLDTWSRITSFESG